MASSLKRSFFLLLSILLLSLVGFSIVSGKAPWQFGRDRATEVWQVNEILQSEENRGMRGVAENTENISVENIRFATTIDTIHKFFMKENKITIECALRHELPSLHSYTVVIKTDREEIFKKTVTPQLTEQTLTFSTSFIPKNSGTIPIACRADLEKKVQESDERDNRMVKFLLVF